MRSDEIQRLLPAVFRAAAAPGTPLAAAIGVMEELHRPIEERLKSLHQVLDPRRAPFPFVNFLARFVDLDPGLALGEDPLRALVALGAELSRWRGTARGLLAFLEVATGAIGFRIEEAVFDENGARRPFHIRVWAPAALRAYKDDIEKIVVREKPAYVTHELNFE